MHRISIFMFLILHVLSSCRELVQDEFEPYGPKPVVNSIIQNDSLIKVHVSMARELGDNPLVEITNATVELFEDDQFIEKLSYREKGVYVSETSAQSNVAYHIRVRIPGYETINARCTIPESSDILKIRHVEKAGISQEGWAYPAIKVCFETNPNQSRYYEIIVSCYDDGEVLHPGFHSVIDPVLQNEGISQALFSNELIEADTYNIHINYSTDSYGADEVSSQSMHLYPLVVELRAVDYQYYRYQKQRYLYEIGRYPEFNISRQTAFQLHSNVDNAHGIFAGFAASRSDTIYPHKINK